MKTLLAILALLAVTGCQSLPPSERYPVKTVDPITEQRVDHVN